ncbi:aminoglycoside phosphotransferase family protein [Bdellovibrio sp. HCB-162]|uniref:aminoglycoside phosphotransferase family protein n=1 Tax=Bdellovibrio sp. HCB-162 TaxID=3394234 RepID=UPI0039BC4AEF
MEFPKEFTKNILEVYGAEGKAWLAELPLLLQKVSQKWKLQSLTPVHNLSFNFVARVTMENGTKAILKMGPSGADYSKETLWLSSYQGLSPQVVAFDRDFNVFFMEELNPGQTLQGLTISGHDNEATRTVARLIKSLYVAHQVNVPPHIPHLAELISSFRFLDGVLEKKLLDKGVAIYRELSQPSSGDVFLHGDLHHDNILLSGTEWKIIDPHGYVGDKVSEVGSMIYNPLDWSPSGSLKAFILRRLDVLCEELPFDPQRIRAWAFAKTMLSIAWDFEGGQRIPPQELAIARILDEVID